MASSSSSPLLNLVCSGCVSVNRVPIDRIHDRPICGKCKQQLLPSKPVDLTDQSFSKFITKSSGPVLVDFWAPWCGPCRQMAPEFAKAAAQLSPTVVLAKLDTEAYPSPAAPFNITGIPTMILFENGREAGRQTGALDAMQISNWVSSLI